MAMVGTCAGSAGHDRLCSEGQCGISGDDVAMLQVDMQNKRRNSAATMETEATPAPSTKPPPFYVYRNLGGLGTCLTPDDAMPPYRYFAHNGQNCEGLCNNLKALPDTDYGTCGGYSAAGLGDCIIWQQDILKGGGTSWTKEGLSGTMWKKFTCMKQETVGYTAYKGDCFGNDLQVIEGDKYEGSGWAIARCAAACNSNAACVGFSFGMNFRCALKTYACTEEEVVQDGWIFHAKHPSTSTTTTQMICVPYTEEACKQAATSQGLLLGGGGYEFAGSHGTKGCYSYSSGAYKGMAFYGTGGSDSQSKAAVSAPKMRVPGADCGKQTCAPYSEEACKQAATDLGLSLGGGGSEFAGSHSTKGCYTYISGSKYKGMAFFGRGGSSADRNTTLDSRYKKMKRVPGADCGAQAFPRYSTSCWGAGWDKASRDAACAGDMMCSIRGRDDRFYSDCDSGCCTAKLPRYSTTCAIGSDKASRDEACAGTMVCARKGYDNRTFGDCVGSHCCSEE